VNPNTNPLEIKTEDLTRLAYAPYGSVIAAEDGIPTLSANLGTAERYNHLGKLENRRGEQAQANLCVFRSQPFTGKTFEVKILERHEHSTQVFIPMTGSERYLVVVCQGGDTPDLNTLKAFIARKGQGITYHPGVWHHPLIALDQVTDFACVVFENGEEDDCAVFEVKPEPRIILI
jgi:ureidoglycolate hydrolase